MAVKVAVIGASGRMGSHAVEAVKAADGMELVATIGREDDLSSVVEAGAEVAVELTVPKSTEDNVHFLVSRGSTLR